MTTEQFKQGISLRYAYIPAHKQDIDTFLSAHPCSACGLATPFESEDWGDLYQRGDAYFYITPKPCQCGFANRIYILANTLMLHSNPSLPDSHTALQDANDQGLLDLDPIEEGFHEIVVGVQLKQHEKAFKAAEALTLDFPGHAAVWYYLGWLQSDRGLLESALDSFDKALQINAEYAEVWYNKSFVLRMLGRFAESRVCLERYYMIDPDAVVENAGRGNELARGETSFGVVRVTENEAGRRLLINDQIQGGAFLEPSAAEVAPGLAGPGPAMETFYIVGWLIAGAHHREGEALMLGLGSGIGAVAMLYCFPAISVTVVETEAVVLELARTYFPLLGHYETQGRLTIVQDDALHFVNSTEKQFDFAFLDLYGGDNEPAPAMAKREAITQICKVSADVWLNLLGRPNKPGLLDSLPHFEAAGMPLRYFFPLLNESTWTEIDSNWVATSADVQNAELEQFKPYRELSGRNIDQIRECYRFMKEGRLPAKDLIAMRESAP